MKLAIIILVAGVGCASTVAEQQSDAPPADSVPPAGKTPPRHQRIAAGGNHTCVVHRDTRAVRCWGLGLAGQLGLGYNDRVTHPKAAPSLNLPRDVDTLIAGDNHTCAIHSRGSGVRCWGDNHDGQLGLGITDNIGDNETPTNDVDWGGRVSIAAAAGVRHTCVLAATDEVYCWGNNRYGAVGYGMPNTIGDDEPARDAGPVALASEASVVDLAGNYGHVCAVFDDGTFQCWGDNTYGQLGLGHKELIGDDETPASSSRINMQGIKIVEVANGLMHSCARSAAGHVYCWGRGAQGALGLGRGEDAYFPSDGGPLNLPAAATRIAAGKSFTCALLATGNLYCWGNNDKGQLGLGNNFAIGYDERPFAPVDLGQTKVVDFAVGAAHVCARTDDDKHYCWGDNYHGQLGYGHRNNIRDDELPRDSGPLSIW